MRNSFPKRIRDSRNHMSLGTFALALVLSPSFLQTGTLTCAKTGDTTLTSLEIEVLGVNQIAFDPTQRSYDLATDADTMLVRAVSTDPEAQISYNFMTPATFLSGAWLGFGQGEVAVALPPGPSTFIIFVQAPGRARDSYVTNIIQGADFPCTEQKIRDAIAAGGGPHVFDCGAPFTVTTQAEIVIDNDVVLDGLGLLGVTGVGHRFSVAAGVTAELRGFVIHEGGGGELLGSGIKVASGGTLTLVDSVLLGNGVSTFGIDNDGTLTARNISVSNYALGGIYNGGALTLEETTVLDNGDSVDCESSANLAEAVGQGLVSGSPVTITDSVLCDVFAGPGPTITRSTLYDASLSGQATVTASTLVGEVRIAGGLLLNSTVSGDLMYYGGEGLQVVHSTVASTIVDCGLGPAPPMTFRSSIITAGCTCTRTASDGFNIESPLDSCGLDQATDQVAVSAAELNLGPLTNNGGLTETYAPLPGSVAVDEIPPAACTDPGGAPLTLDQRGLARPQGPACDVGSVEAP